MYDEVYLCLGVIFGILDPLRSLLVHLEVNLRMDHIRSCMRLKNTEMQQLDRTSSLSIPVATTSIERKMNLIKTDRQ